MGIFQNGCLGAAALAGAMAITSNASAVTPTEQGTLTIAAERMLGAGVSIQNGEANFGMTLLPARNPAPLQFPRIGVDYFVIDGLSLGGNLGFTYWGGGGGQVAYIIEPRVGYEFELAKTLEFWPRGGFGVIGVDPGGASPYLAGEAMFEWTFLPQKAPRVAMLFGGTFDFAFDWDTYEFAGNVGLSVDLLP
jgi:hypothetical protein